MILCVFIDDEAQVIITKGAKLLKDIFSVTQKKLPEKTFFQSVAICVIGMLLCLTALGSMTYAWFTNETSSNSNMLTSGAFDLTISVCELTDGALSNNDISLTPDLDIDGKYSCNLEAGTYIVTLNLTDESTVKGHCVVKVGELTPQYTAAIVGERTVNAENQTITDPFTFTITITEATTVSFEARWGVAVSPDISNGGELVFAGAFDSDADTIDKDK